MNILGHTMKSKISYMIAFSLFFFGCGQAQMKKELLETYARLKETEEKLKTTEMELKNNKILLKDTQKELEDTQKEFQEMVQSFANTKKQLEDTKEILQLKENSLANTQKRLKDTQAKLQKVNQEKVVSKSKETPRQAYERLMDKTSEMIYMKYLGLISKSEIRIKLEQSMNNSLNPSLISMIETNETKQKQNAPDKLSDEEMIKKLENAFNYMWTKQGYQ